MIEAVRGVELLTTLVLEAIMVTPDSRNASEEARCAECGAAVAEGQVGCQKLFDAVRYKEFDDYRYARLHRLTIDT